MINKTITATITNVPIEFEYIDIDYDTIVMEDWDNVSRIIIENSDFNTDTYPKMPIFFDDGFSGIHNYSESSSDLYIERGSSASFEALSLMGQMNSVEDIERYRGDLFKIGNGNS